MNPCNEDKLVKYQMIDTIKEEEELPSDGYSSSSSSYSSLISSNRPKKFWPEKPQTEKIKANTVLTNLQRGNIPTMQTIVEPELITNLHQRAGQGEIKLSDITPEKVDMIDSKGRTLLTWAASYGQTPTVRMLLRLGANVHSRGYEDETPLHLASSNGHHDVVRLLLSHSASVDALDENGCTPLMFAAMNNHPHTVNELLINNADVTLTNINEDDAYYLCTKYKADLARMVIENHCSSVLKKYKTTTIH